MRYKFRAGNAEDLPFLKEMLYEAVFWDPQAKRNSIGELFAIPEITKTLDHWHRRDGDFAIIALDDRDKPVAAVWYRFWTRADHSFGFVDENTPEIWIAVHKEHRRNGLGTELMKRMIDHASQAGIKYLSLSVDPGIYARELYQKLGFNKVGESGTSWTMSKSLLDNS